MKGKIFLILTTFSILIMNYAGTIKTAVAADRIQIHSKFFKDVASARFNTPQEVTYLFNSRETIRDLKRAIAGTLNLDANQLVVTQQKDPAKIDDYVVLDFYNNSALWVFPTDVYRAQSYLPDLYKKYKGKAGTHYDGPALIYPENKPNIYLPGDLVSVNIDGTPVYGRVEQIRYIVNVGAAAGTPGGLREVKHQDINGKITQ